MITKTMLMGLKNSLLALFACFACLDVALAAAPSADAVINQMHARYQNAWYDSVIFSQEAKTYNDDGTTKVETWYERGLLPGKLRIDIGAPADGNAMIMNEGKLYTFHNGTQTESRPYVNLLLLLGFDVYRQPAAVTLATLKSEGIDTSKVHRESWQGQAVYVIGADKGDVTSKQFWVEIKRLLCVRVIQPDRRKPDSIADIRFLDYRAQPKGWIAARMEFRRDDKLYFTEIYSDIVTGKPLDSTLFDAEHYQAASPSR